MRVMGAQHYLVNRARPNGLNGPNGPTSSVRDLPACVLPLWARGGYLATAIGRDGMRKRGAGLAGNTMNTALCDRKMQICEATQVWRAQNADLRNDVRQTQWCARCKCAQRRQNQCRYRGRGSRGAELLARVPGRAAAGRGATKRRPARPEKGAQWRRKRFHETAHTERAHRVDDESGFVENSRQESSGGSRLG